MGKVRRGVRLIGVVMTAVGLTSLGLAYVAPGAGATTPWLAIDGSVRSSGSLDWSASTSGPGVFAGGTFVDATTPPVGPTVVAAAAADAGFLGASFVVDPLAGDSTVCGAGDPNVFTGAGGEKNGDLISGMTFGTGSVPAKDELSNVYAAAHAPGVGQAELYFGAERVVSSGDSHIDFELFHAAVGMSGDCSGHLTGDRSQGDLLITTDFSNGGTFAGYGLHEWRCAPDASPQPAVGTVCNPTSHASVAHYASRSTSITQLTVNASATSCGDWACRKANGAQVASLLANVFLEGRINLDSAAFGGCGVTFVPHTRSAPQFSASLKDVIAPTTLNTCLTPSLSTTSSPTGAGQTPGVQASDTATVSAYGSPVTTGTVQFALCGPLATAAGCATGGSDIGGPQALDSAGHATSPQLAATVATSAGTYCWRADYSPTATNRLNTATHTNTGTECFTVAPQNPTITTSSTPSGQTGFHPTAGDSVTVSGPTGAPTPEGTVAFYLCGPADVTTAGCPSGGTSVGSAVLSSGQADSPTTAATTTIGTYCWRASYTPATGSPYLARTHTNATSECFTTTDRPVPSLTTLSSPTGATGFHPNASDTATLAYTSDGSPIVPQGSVSFYLCSPAQSSTSGCPAGLGTFVGSTSVGTTGTATSPVASDTSTIGRYCWRAHYTPSEGSIFGAIDHTDADTECFTTSAVDPVLSSTAGASTLTIGGPVSDSAAATGAEGVPSGSVSFYLCGPSDVTALGCPSGSGAQVGTAVALVAGRANSVSSTATGVAGRYCWRVVYHPSAGSPYAAAEHTNATSECSTASAAVIIDPTTTTSTSTTTTSTTVGLKVLGEQLVRSTPTTVATRVMGETLARTGIEAERLLAFGCMLMALGAALLVATRRRLV